MKKNGAIELSTSTLIIIILSVVLLVLGVYFVTKTMCISIHGIENLDDVIKTEMRALFVGNDKKVAIKEKNNSVASDIDYGVAFLIRNDDIDNATFEYALSVVDLGNCQLSEADALSFVKLGKRGQLSVQKGSEGGEVIKFNIPKGKPLCSLRYELTVSNGGQVYGSDTFDIAIKKSSFITRSFC